MHRLNVDQLAPGLLVGRNLYNDRGDILLARGTRLDDTYIEAIRQRGIPVKISNSAGTFACNQLMYTSLHMIDLRKFNTLCGFIHVPVTPSYVAKENDAYHEVPSMNLDLMVDAVTTAISVSLRRDAGIETAFGAG